MRKLVFAINVTLDGCADHESVIADDELHTFYTGLLRTADAGLYGRVTYELMASYWPIAPELPTSTPSEIEFAHAINRIPKVVFSSTLDKVTWNNSRLVSGNALEEVHRLKNQPGKDLLVGGLSLAAFLADAGLIDEYWFLVQPILAGAGKPLFKQLGHRIDLQLMQSWNLRSGVAVLHYRVKDGAAAGG